MFLCLKPCHVFLGRFVQKSSKTNKKLITYTSNNEVKSVEHEKIANNRNVWERAICKLLFKFERTERKQQYI